MEVHSGNDVINFKTQDEWEIQLRMIINFISSKDFDENRTIHTKSNYIEIMKDNETGEIVEKLFESLLQKYQEELEGKMRGSEFVFDSVDLFHYNFHKISLNRGGSFKDSPKWLKNKKSIIIPKNNDDKCFQYAITVALNHQNIKNNPERITKIKSFIDQYNWNEISFPVHRNDWTKFEVNNKSIALNVL